MHKITPFFNHSWFLTKDGVSYCDVHCKIFAKNSARQYIGATYYSVMGGQPNVKVGTGIKLCALLTTLMM